MHKLVFIFLLAFLFSCGTKKNTGNENEQTTSELSPTEISIDEAVHNFGHLEAGEIVVHTFVLSNTGDSDFVIQSLETDCGCVNAQYNKKHIKPGETGLIEVEFNTAGLVGREYKTIEILGNSKELKHIAIFAQVKNEIIDIKY
ncbi:DUF1573 domain-containing protein [Draconibacterium sp. IB214405]|uniref:DUF1573 domain-containing protein n=1 Tax=Draconibacterium sp. IB214405 TaxID=3097352 RepID=UPI002A171262|nr:DUF1573 domain-containing protein [Draconibacterium sp. IB214405]MDX8339151.1 DUF1573 domain-containing protein [Draconibacterium sp. IB214405]